MGKLQKYARRIIAYPFIILNNVAVPYCNRLMDKEGYSDRVWAMRRRIRSLQEIIIKIAGVDNA